MRKTSSVFVSLQLWSPTTQFPHVSAWRRLLFWNTFPPTDRFSRVLKVIFTATWGRVHPPPPVVQWCLCIERPQQINYLHVVKKNFSLHCVHTTDAWWETGSVCTYQLMCLSVGLSIRSQREGSALTRSLPSGMTHRLCNTQQMALRPSPIIFLHAALPPTLLTQHWLTQVNSPAYKTTIWTFQTFILKDDLSDWTLFYLFFIKLVTQVTAAALTIFFFNPWHMLSREVGANMIFFV